LADSPGAAGIGGSVGSGRRARAAGAGVGVGSLGAAIGELVGAGAADGLARLGSGSNCAGASESNSGASPVWGPGLLGLPRGTLKLAGLLVPGMFPAVAAGWVLPAGLIVLAGLLAGFFAVLDGNNWQPGTKTSMALRIKTRGNDFNIYHSRGGAGRPYGCMTRLAGAI
jgi:hypothetical protein